MQPGAVLTFLICGLGIAGALCWTAMIIWVNRIPDARVNEFQYGWTIAVAWLVALLVVAARLTHLI